MLGALSCGHDGSLCTVHAGSPAEALRRLETLALMAGVGLPHAAIREQVADALHLVVCQARQPDGTPRRHRGRGGRPRRGRRRRPHALRAARRPPDLAGRAVGPAGRAAGRGGVTRGRRSMAFAAAAAGVAGAWECSRRSSGRGSAAWLEAALRPLARARREGRLPSAPERRRLTLLACGLPARGGLARRPGRALGVVAAVAGPAASGALRRVAAPRLPRAARGGARPTRPARWPPGSSAGRSVRGAIGEAARGLDGPAGHELRRTAAALAAGRPTERGARGPARARAASRAWDTLVAAVLVQRDAGGDLPGAAARARRLPGGRGPRRPRRPRGDRPGALHRPARRRRCPLVRARPRRARQPRLRRRPARQPALAGRCSSLAGRAPGRRLRRRPRHLPPAGRAMTRACSACACAGRRWRRVADRRTSRPRRARRRGGRGRARRGAARRSAAGSARRRAPRDLADRLDAAGSAADASRTRWRSRPAARARRRRSPALLLAAGAPGRLGLVLPPAGAAAGFVALDVWLRHAQRAPRGAAIAVELPDVVDLLRVALEAGLPPTRALAEVGRRHRGVLAAELRARRRADRASASRAREALRRPRAPRARATASPRSRPSSTAPTASAPRRPRRSRALARDAREARGPRPGRGGREGGAEDPARRRAAARPERDAARRRGARARAARRACDCRLAPSRSPS